MALSKSGLSGFLETSLTSSAPPTNSQELKKFCDALAEALVQYLVANTVVTITQAVAQTAQGPAPVTGVGTIS